MFSKIAHLAVLFILCLVSTVDTVGQIKQEHCKVRHNTIFIQIDALALKDSQPLPFCIRNV